MKFCEGVNGVPIGTLIKTNRFPHILFLNGNS